MLFCISQLLVSSIHIPLLYLSIFWDRVLFNLSFCWNSFKYLLVACSNLSLRSCWQIILILLLNGFFLLQWCKGYVGSKIWALKRVWFCFFPQSTGYCSRVLTSELNFLFHVFLLDMTLSNFIWQDAQSAINDLNGKSQELLYWGWCPNFFLNSVMIWKLMARLDCCVIFF